LQIKRFFSEEKKQKTFVSLSRFYPAAYRWGRKLSAGVDANIVDTQLIGVTRRAQKPPRRHGQHGKHNKKRQRDRAGGHVALGFIWRAAVIILPGSLPLA
jgi:hypothetical protein